MPFHLSRLVRDFSSSKSLRVVRQASYSPNFSFEDFWLYLKLKALQNKFNFKDSEDLKDFLFDALNSSEKSKFINQKQKMYDHFLL